MTCHACGAQLSATAKFCHKCGAAVARAGATGWRAGLPWGLGGAALGAMVTVLVMRASRPPEMAPGQPGIVDAGASRAPDISQMSPEERANRLFNRVMILAQNGKQDSVQFFLPMALGAYVQLRGLDADARYHIGRLELVGGDAAAALAQADTIRQSVPNHLFIYVLRAQAFQQQGDTARERRAYADFLRNEAAELARHRPEYGADAHGLELSGFHTEALRRKPAS